MPYNPELGMRVYDPREGAMLGQQMAEAIMQNQYRKGVLALQQEAAMRDKARDQIAMEEAKRKAKSMILRDIGLVQMQKEFDSMMRDNPDMDPLEARKKALWNASHLLFAENPQEIPNLMQDEARADYNQRSLAERIRHAQEMEKGAEDTRGLRKELETSRLDQARERLDMAKEKAANQVPESTKLKIDALNNRIKVLTAQHKSLVDDIENGKSYKALRARITWEIADLQKQIEKLSSGNETVETTTDTKEDAPGVQTIGRFKVTVKP